MRHKLALMAATIAAVASVATAASAATMTFDFSGNSPLGTYDAIVSLDVVNGQALSGQGTITGNGFSGETVTLLTPSTPGAEQDGGGLFGYRFNDGTDIFNEDTAVPIDSLGLLFAIGATPAPGQNAGFAIWDNGGGNYVSFFAGHVSPRSPNLYGGGDNGGATTVTSIAAAAPEPAAWALMMLAVGGLGFVLRRQNARDLADALAADAAAA